jgi:hypothetical protein
VLASEGFRAGVAGGGVGALNLLRCYPSAYHGGGGIVPRFAEDEGGGPLGVTISDGADSKPQPTNHRVALRTTAERLTSENGVSRSAFYQENSPYLASQAFFEIRRLQKLPLISIFPSSHQLSRRFGGGGVMADEVKAIKRQKQRSPEHPGISLQEAVERAQVFYGHEVFNYAPVNVAKKHWGYGELSSSGMRILAALLHYGLFEEEGGGKGRRVRLTALGKAILLDKREDSTERDDALRKAALNPVIFATLWKKWGPALPSDANMEFELVQNFKFNPDSVRPFIKDFKATIAFAKLAQSGEVEDVGDETAKAENLPKIGGEFVARPKAPHLPPQGGQMPMTHHAQNAMPPLDVTIPLTGGRRATLRIPSELTDAEFNLILDLVRENMTRMKPMIVQTTATAYVGESGKVEHDWDPLAAERNQ